MEVLQKFKGWLTPRRQSWIALVVPYVFFVIAISFFPEMWAMLLSFSVWFGAAFFRILQKCPACGVSIARAPFGVPGLEVQIYTPLTPKRCANGHKID